MSTTTLRGRLAASCRFCPAPVLGQWNSEPLQDTPVTWGDDGVRRPAAGDQVFITLATPHAPGADMPEAGRPYSFVVGEGHAVAGIEAIVMRLAPGQTIEEDVAWPADFPDAQWLGMTKRVRITLVQVRWASDLLRPEGEADLHRRMTLMDPYWRLRHSSLAPDALRKLQVQYDARLTPRADRLIALGIANDTMNAPEDEPQLFSLAMAYHERRRRRAA